MDITLIFNECNSWLDFHAKLLALNKKEKGNAFELLTKLYFKINPVYSFYDEVWLLNEVPQKTIELLNIPSHDLGIDLIAKSGDEYHAIQCKFHTDIDSSVSFKEVSTFISLLEGNKMFTQGYICSSANLTSRNLEKIETKPIARLLADTWQNLEVDFFDKARKFLNKEKYTPLPFKPKEHQIKAINQALEYFEKENNTRGKLIFPCGAGKSLTGFWLTQTLKSKATIIAVPSLSLVKQTLDVYLREIVAEGKKVKWLCICSDEGIGTDEEIVFKTENLGVPCQTDISFIKNWLEENQQEEIVVFTTYQSGRIISEVAKTLNFSFDVGIFDEAHKTVGSSKKLFSYLLFDEKIAIKKRIFMTATERFYAGSKDEIISMDDEEIYGDIFAQMSFKDAINLGLLTDYKVVTIDVTKNEIADFIKDNNLVQLNDKWKKETEARSLASMLALRKAMKLFPIKNAVSFHSSIEKATRNKELQNYITETYNYSPIDTYTVSGKMPTTKRNVVINEFANSPRSLITNARCLTEGVDVPNIDCIVFSDPRKSKVDIVQALGRALRKKGGKDWGYVILPVVYDESTQEIDNENFNEILAIVRGLASNDERIIEYFKDKKEGLPTKSKEKTDQFQFQVFSDYVDANQLASELQVKLWEKLSRFKWMPFEEAREYVKTLKVNSFEEYQKLWRSNKLPNDLPSKPNMTYKDVGFISMPDFLGYDNKFQDWLSYNEAKDFVHKLKLMSTTEWKKYCKSGEKPLNIPSNPRVTYKRSGWVSMGDWLGTGVVASHLKKYRDFDEARTFVRSLKIKSNKEYQKLWRSNKLPDDLPAKPYMTYKDDGFISMSDFFGYQGKFQDWLPYNEAKDFVHKLKLKSTTEWEKYCKSGEKPLNIPSNPRGMYKGSGWVGMGDWLGTEVVASQLKKYRDFDEARTFVRILKIKSNKEYQKLWRSNKLPDDLPAKPDKTYKDDGFISIPDFLGYESRMQKWLPFELAKDFVHKLKLDSPKQWRDYSKSEKKPINLPASPDKVYKNKGWSNWTDFLGNSDVRHYKNNVVSFEEAKKFVVTLKIKNVQEWLKFCKSGKRPYNIPSKPQVRYLNQGWKGWADFLRKEDN